MLLSDCDETGFGFSYLKQYFMDEHSLEEIEIEQIFQQTFDQADDGIFFSCMVFN